RVLQADRRLMDTVGRPAGPRLAAVS
ncbi:MAG: hypothetical protein QOH87_3655, partial [Trebonia sp.]|nr:hypothetical protein [Trebonia sp.]